MREVNAVCVFCRHFRQVVEPPRAERTRTESYSVVLVRHGGKQSVVVFFVSDDSRQAENIPRRIIGMYCHIYSRFITRGHYAFKEIYEVFKQHFVCYALVFGEQTV